MLLLVQQNHKKAAWITWLSWLMHFKTENQSELFKNKWNSTITYFHFIHIFKMNESTETKQINEDSGSYSVFSTYEKVKLQ